MKFNTYIKAPNRPEVYTPGTATMWNDPYISQQLLQTHLSPDIDLASRKKSTISSTIDWILEKVPGKKLKILDLGCGPGLYTEELARIGHQVKGVDISATSIHYARKSAESNGLDIAYTLQNYEELEDTGCYDLIMMIFTDFGVLVPDSRKKVLANIYHALKPGGIFLFDVLNDNYPIKETGSKEWDKVQSGFWKATPYLALQENHYYHQENVCLNQHIVIAENGATEIYRFWTHAFSHGTITEFLKAGGFSRVGCFDNILPDSELYRSEEVTFCIGAK